MYGNTYFAEIIAEDRLKELRRESQEARLIQSTKDTKKRRKFQLFPSIKSLTKVNATPGITLE